MELYSNMMTIYWSPTIHQVGEHRIVINAFDGLEHGDISFTVTVEELVIEPEGEEEGSSVVLMVILILVILLVLAGSVGFFLFMKRKKDGSLENIEGEISKREEKPIQEDPPEEKLSLGDLK
jgi:heme/copper-type cytochrome/quinol oxidase subunit 2